MSLESLSNLGFGGAEGDRLNEILAELQGLTFNIVTGDTATTAIPLGDIEAEDTIAAVLNLTDLTELDPDDFTIADRRASGTLVVAEAVADGDEIEVNGKVYTFVEVPDPNSIAYNWPPYVIPIVTGPSGTDNPDVIDRVAKVIMSGDSDLYAEDDGVDTVTIWNRVAGTVGNAVTLVVANSGGHVTRSAATLLGGTATHSISGADSTAAKKLLVIWYNKTPDADEVLTPLLMMMAVKSAGAKAKAGPKLNIRQQIRQAKRQLAREGDEGLGDRGDEGLGDTKPGDDKPGGPGGPSWGPSNPQLPNKPTPGKGPVKK